MFRKSFLIHKKPVKARVYATCHGIYELSINGKKVSDRVLEDYGWREHPYISVRIGIRDDAQCVGGINIFGERFGDYPQNLVLKLIYAEAVE